MVAHHRRSWNSEGVMRVAGGRRIWPVPGLVAVWVALGLATSPGLAQRDPVQAARAEGRVVVYGTMAADNFDVIARIFRGRYGVDAEYWRAAPD